MENDMLLYDQHQLNSSEETQNPEGILAVELKQNDQTQIHEILPPDTQQQLGNIEGGKFSEDYTELTKLEKPEGREFITMKTILSNLKKKIALNNAKKLNNKVNRKRKRGPEPSNSAVYYYRMEVLDDVAERYPNASPNEVIEIVQNQWLHLDKKEQEQYYQLEEVDQRRFEKEAKQYIPRSEGGTMKRPKRRKHPNAPKHPMSAYLFFVSDNRKKFKAENPEKNFTEIAILLGKKWREIDEEDRKKYDQLANDDKKRYRKEKMDFEPCPISMSSKKRKKNPFAPKHPQSAYLFFVANNRAEFNKRYPDKNFTQVAKLLGRHWKNLSPKEERKYQILAAADKKRYEEEKQNWQPPIEREANYIQMPKKPMSAYSYWAYSQRAKTIQEHPYVDKKDLTRVLRESWNNISDKEKHIYIDKAEMDRQRYQRELSMLPMEYIPKVEEFKHDRRRERLLRIPQVVLNLTSQDIQKIMLCCGVNPETIKKLASSDLTGENFVQYTASKLKTHFTLENTAEIRKICRIISILSI